MSCCKLLYAVASCCCYSTGSQLFWVGCTNLERPLAEFVGRCCKTRGFQNWVDTKLAVCGCVHATAEVFHPATTATPKTETKATLGSFKRKLVQTKTPRNVRFHVDWWVTRFPFSSTSRRRFAARQSWTCYLEKHLQFCEPFCARTFTRARPDDADTFGSSDRSHPKTLRFR